MQKLLILFCFLLGACTKPAPIKQSPSYPVRAEKVLKKDVPIYLETIGNVEPTIHVNITSRVQGEITGVYFEEGQEVDQGDLLFTIDPRTFEASLRKAEGEAQEYAAKLDIAREKVLRFSPLAEEDYYAKIQFDELKSNLHALEGSYLQAKASVDSAKVELGYCWIYSPLKGRTGILQVDQGNILPGTEKETLVSVNQIRPTYVTFFFPEKYLSEIQRFKKSSSCLQTVVSRDGFRQDFLYGKLEMLDNTIDTDTGTITLKAIFPNEQEALWPGQYVQVRLILYVEKEALLLPYSAIHYDSQGAFAFMISHEETISKRYLHLGKRIGDEVIVEKGAQDGELAVTLGGQNLFTGAKVSMEKGDRS